MYLAAYELVFPHYGWAVAATALLVIVSQLKINVTNAYAGSLAWSNFFARVTHSHPGRVVWVVFNTLIALMLMELEVFRAIGGVLGLVVGLVMDYGPFALSIPFGLAGAAIGTWLISQAFIRVTLPLALPGIFAGSLLTFIPAVGDFVNAELLGNPQSLMIGNVIQARYLQVTDYPTASALSFILMLAILIGLLLPAVQKVREAAARTQCTNNTKQLGLAIHTFHDTQGYFAPPAITNAMPFNPGWAGPHGWGQFLLPYFEQQNMFNQYRWDLAAGWAAPENQPVITTTLKIMTCPSAPQPATQSPTIAARRCRFAGVRRSSSHSPQVPSTTGSPSSFSTSPQCWRQKRLASGWVWKALT